MPKIRKQMLVCREGQLTHLFFPGCVGRGYGLEWTLVVVVSPWLRVGGEVYGFLKISMFFYKNCTFSIKNHFVGERPRDAPNPKGEHVVTKKSLFGRKKKTWEATSRTSG